MRPECSMGESLVKCACGYSNFCERRESPISRREKDSQAQVWNIGYWIMVGCRVMKNGTEGYGDFQRYSSQKKKLEKNYPDHSIRCGTQRRDKNAGHDSRNVSKLAYLGSTRRDALDEIRRQ